MSRYEFYCLHCDRTMLVHNECGCSISSEEEVDGYYQSGNELISIFDSYTPPKKSVKKKKKKTPYVKKSIKD